MQSYQMSWRRDDTAALTTFHFPRTYGELTGVGGHTHFMESGIFDFDMTPVAHLDWKSGVVLMISGMAHAPSEYGRPRELVANVLIDGAQVAKCQAWSVRNDDHMVLNSCLVTLKEGQQLSVVGENQTGFGFIDFWQIFALGDAPGKSGGPGKP